LKVFEKRVLRRISGAKRQKVVGCWRRLHKEEPYKCFCSADIIR
jgi:hypothetical protein